MMKKLLLVTCLLGIGFGTNAQNFSVASKAAPPDTIVTDTVFYYFNKQWFKTGGSIKPGVHPVDTIPFYKSAAATSTQVTHVGSKFENKDKDLTVSGLMSFAFRLPVVASKSISVHLYLCNLNSSGMPVLPPVDSVMSKVYVPPSPTGFGRYMQIGGVFPNNRTHVMPGNFAVLFRNMSTVPGDTVGLMRTAGKTFTNQNASPAEKISEGNGFVRWNQVFYSATNYTAPGFGNGTDYEFSIAPIVTFTLHSEHQIPQNVQTSTLCIFDVATFTNISSPEFSSRYFNMFEFVRKWNQNPVFNPSTAPVNGWPQDSAITWNFEPNEQGFGWNRPPGPRVDLPYNSQTNTIKFSTARCLRTYDDQNDSAVCWPANQFRTRWRSMNIYGRGAMVKTKEDFTVCTDCCGRWQVGVGEYDVLSKLVIAPNPTRDGITRLSGLRGDNTVTVMDIMGQLIYSETTDKVSHQVNLQSHAAGTYFVKVTNKNGEERVLKVLKE
jgi:hypothetical protein